MNCDPTKVVLSIGTAVGNDSLPFRTVYDVYYFLLTGVQFEDMGF